MKKVIASGMALLILFTLSACGRKQPQVEAALSETWEAPAEQENPAASTADSGETTVPKTTQMLQPEPPRVNMTAFLENYNRLLADWGIPFTADLSEESAAIYQSRYSLRLTSLETQEAYSDKYDHGRAFQGWFYAVYQGERPLYKADLTCFDGAPEELKAVFSQLCAAASVALDPEIIREEALAIPEMEHTYQSDSFSYNWYETSLCSHVFSWSANSSYANSSYAITVLGLADYENSVNTYGPLDPEYLEYEFPFDPCPEGAMGMVFDSYGYSGYLRGYLYDLGCNTALEQDEATRTFQFKEISNFLLLNRNTFSIVSLHATIEGEDATQYIRLRCDQNSLKNEPLAEKNSVLLENPQHLFRPAIGLLQLCDAGMSAQEAIDLCTGNVAPTLITDSGMEVIQHCPRNAMTVILLNPDTGALDITISTRKYFDATYGSLEAMVNKNS